MSLRVQNFETTESKVNDSRGNPIIIQCVVVWRVLDTCKALYAVDDYTSFLKTQAESAMREVAQ